MGERKRGSGSGRSASRDSNSGCPKSNGAICRRTTHKVIGSYKIKRLKGSYDAFLKIIILCIWCNRIFLHALMLKKHFWNTVHYCRSSMPRLSQTLAFLQSSSFQQAQSALIGQLAQCIVIGRTPQALVGNVTPLSIIASFSFQNKRQLIMSLVLPSVQAQEGNRVAWQTQWWCSYVFANKPRVSLSHTSTHTHTHTHTTLWCDSLSLSLSHTHKHAQNSAFEQSIANT